MSWNLDEEEKLIRQWLTQLQHNEYKSQIWKCINGQKFSLPNRNNNNNNQDYDYDIESKEEIPVAENQEPWRLDIDLPQPTEKLPLFIPGSIEMLKRLPAAVYRRIQNARQRYRVQYFDETGLFVAISLVSPDQRGIFTWRRFDQGEFIGAYTGLIWDKDLFNVYYSDNPLVYMQKERYLFTYDETKFMDPTSLNGSLYSDFSWNPNLMPLVNEPPPWDAANARPMQPADPREVAQKQIRFEACVDIVAYSEIYIRYDNPEDPYEQRTYPVGWTCQQVRSKNFMSNFVDFQQQRLEAQQNALVNQTSTKNTLIQLKQYQQDRRTSGKYNNYLKPRIVQDPDNYSKSGYSSSSSANKRVKITNGTGSLSDAVHYVWDMLKVVLDKTNQSYRVYAAVDLPLNSRIPIFGLPLTESVFRYREQIRSDPDYPRPSYLFALRSGFLDCDPVYQSYSDVGGKGLFVAALVRTALDLSDPNSNMRLVTSGFLSATRRIRAGEELVREFPVPRRRRTKAEMAQEQLEQKQQIQTTTGQQIQQQVEQEDMVDDTDDDNTDDDLSNSDEQIQQVEIPLSRLTASNQTTTSLNQWIAPEHEQEEDDEDDQYMQ